MPKHDPVTKETIERLGALAGLPVPASRHERLLAMLAGLITAANELNRKMADGSRRGVLPITRFPER